MLEIELQILLRKAGARLNLKIKLISLQIGPAGEEPCALISDLT
jgi:hypothetical protein